MSTWCSTFLYPGVLQVDNVGYGHGIYAAGSEIPTPIAAIGQGTVYHFPVTGTSTGTSVHGWSETHHHRAWHLVGWESSRAQGDVVIPNSIWFGGTTGPPYPDPPAIAFDGTLSGSISDKYMAKASDITGTFAGPPAHRGDSGGELQTNCNTVQTDLGMWTFYGLNATTFTQIDGGVAATVAIGNANVGHESETGTNEVRYVVEARAYGNTSVLRYNPGGGGSWQYVSLFLLELRARVEADAIPDGWYYKPDGTQNPDTGIFISGAYTSDYVTCSSIETGDSIGYAHLISTESTTPDPDIYAPETPATPLWADVIVTFDDPKYAIGPDPL